MGQPDRLAELRLLTKSVELGHKESWQAPSLDLGVPKGVLVELIGNARTEWLLKLFALHQDNLIIWCEREPTVAPTAIHQRGIDLKRIKFINSKGDLQQPLRTALESQLYPFIVAPQRFEDVNIFRRLSLLAEKSKSNIFFLPKDGLSNAWPISLQLEINLSDEGFQIQIHKQKHGTL